jgi:Spy/CpxP family protein refolding chaperone
MSRTIAVAVSIVFLILIVPTVSFAVTETATMNVTPVTGASQPSAAVPQPATTPLTPTVTGGSPMIFPSPCIVSSLRLLNPDRLPMFDERLRLTEDQHSKLQTILLQSQENLKKLIQDHKTAAEAFVTSLTKPGAQQADVQAAAEVTSKAEQAMLMEKIKELFAIRAVLQPDQIAELNTMIDNTTTQWRPSPLPANRPALQNDTTAPLPTITPRAPANPRKLPIP